MWNASAKDVWLASWAKPLRKEAYKFLSLHYRGQNYPSTERKKQFVVSSRRLFRERNFSSSLSRPRPRKTIFYFWHYLFTDSLPANQASYLFFLSERSYFWTLSCSQLNQNADFKWLAAVGSATDPSGFQESTFTPCPPLGKVLSSALPYHDTQRNFPATLCQHHNDLHWTPWSHFFVLHQLP